VVEIRIRAKLFLAVGLALFAMTLGQWCSGQVQAQTESPSLPAAYLVLFEIKKGFQVISIPASDAKDTKPKTRSVPTQRHVYGIPVGVFGGHLLTHYHSSTSYTPIYSGKLMTVDLSDGTVRVLGSNVVKAKYASGQIYLISKLGKKTKEHTHKLTHIDLATLNSTEVCKLRGEEAMMGGPDFALEVSADGKTVAVSDMKKPAHPSDAILARIIFARADNVETVETSYSFRTVTISNGAGHFLKAPEFAWLDNERLLFAGFSTDGSEFKMGRLARRIPMNGEAMKVSVILASDGSVADLCELPKASFPEFVGMSAAKGCATVHLRRLGLHDLDIATGNIEETASLAWIELADSVRQDATKRFPLNSKEIEELHEQNRLLFAPDGKRLAWFSTDSGVGSLSRAFGGDRSDDELFLYEPSMGHHLTYKGKVASSHATSISPPVPFLVWASESEMRPSTIFDDLEILKKVPAKTRAARKDTRPHVKDCLEIDIKTDRETYRRHEPVALTISVKNVTDTNYRFKKSRVTQMSKPFGLENKHERGRSAINLFDHDDNELDADFLDLPPGKTVEFERNVEIKETGKQRFEFEVTNWDIWKGSLTSNAHFEVMEETTPELLKQRFDRTMGAFLRRWEKHEGKGSLHSYRLWPLGDEGAELLVSYLNQCKDDRLRNELTDGLRSTLSDSAMEYLEDRLSTNLEHDAYNVVRCISNMVGRAKWKKNNDKYQKARKLLLAAGKHDNPKAKFKVLEDIFRSLPNDVDQFMLETIEDPNDAVATLAARYVAIRQKVPFKKWLEYARNNPNRATKLAANSFANKIASQWDHELDPKEIKSGLDSNYEQAIGKLIKWCERHPRIAANFFDELALRTNGWRPLPAKKQGKPIDLLQEG